MNGKAMRFTGLALTALLVTGCAGHSHHGARTVKVLEAEHRDRAIVVVHARPASSRHCWRHGRHWHCRR